MYLSCQHGISQSKHAILGHYVNACVLTARPVAQFTAQQAAPAIALILRLVDAANLIHLFQDLSLAEDCHYYSLSGSLCTGHNWQPFDGKPPICQHL